MHDNQQLIVPIAILDFGSQFTHLISRRLRNAGIYCEIFPPDITASELLERQVRGIILSGGPASVYEEGAPGFNESILSVKVPILGICYGYQLMVRALGGNVVPLETKEFGKSEVELTGSSLLFKGLPRTQTVWMSHGDSVVDIPNGFEQVGATHNCKFAVAQNIAEQYYGLQFHPEVAHTLHGQEILINFAVDICKCQPSWGTQKYIETIEGHIREKVRNRNVFLLFSGGIDSTVLFVLLNKFLGQSRVKAAFINTGLLRPGDNEMIRQFITDQGIENCLIIDASDEFLTKLKGVTDPEKKRKIIGQLFLEVKERVMLEIGLDSEHWILAQGTIYPDIITSGGTKHSHVIKTHHNALPSLMNMEVLEPLRYLYKDEIRQIAAELGFSEEFIRKHPFPGPGIAVRIAGDVTIDGKIDLYHKLDSIVIKHLRSSGWYEKLWMGFPILIDMEESSQKDFHFSKDELSRMISTVSDEFDQAKIICDELDISVLPIRSVGVKGDYRSYEHPLALLFGNQHQRSIISHDVVERISNKITNTLPLVNRVLLAITWDSNPEQWKQIVVLRMLLSVDTLTADWAKLEPTLLDNISSEIMSVSDGINAVLLDITQKPPGTMEWE